MKRYKFTCPYCGQQAMVREDLVCKPVFHTCVRNPLPLGRWSKRALEALGITEARLNRLFRRPCKCKKRIRKMNLFGLRLAYRLRLTKRARYETQAVLAPLGIREPLEC